METISYLSIFFYFIFFPLRYLLHISTKGTFGSKDAYEMAKPNMEPFKLERSLLLDLLIEYKDVPIYHSNVIISQ